MDPEQLAAAVAVADESLAAQTADYGLQAAIAQHRPDLWAALASNPTTYPSLLEWLSGIQEPAVRLALEARGIAPQTEAVPQAGEGVPGDARPEGPVEPPAGEAEAAESSADEAEPEAAALSPDPPSDEAEAAAGSSADEAEPADSLSGEDEPEAAAESPDSPSDEAEPAGSSADEAAPEEDVGELPAEGASAGADEDVSEVDASDEPVDSLSGEAEPEAAAVSPDSPSGEAEAAAGSSAEEAAPEEEAGEPPAEGASAGADEVEPEADASDESADAPADEAEPVESPSDVAEPEAAAVSPDSPSDEAEPADSRADGGAPTETIEAGTSEAESAGSPADEAAPEGASAGADEDVSEADASDEPVESPDSPLDEAEPDESPADEAESAESSADEAAPEEVAESLADEAEPAESSADEAAPEGVSLGEVPAPPPETPASTPGTALSAGFASQPAVAPGSFFVPTQAQTAGSLGSAPSPSRTRKPVIIVVILALLLAGGAGGWFLMSVIYDTPITLSLPGQGHKAHRGGGKAAGDSTASDSTPGSVDPTGTSATNYVTPCGSAPTFTPTSVKNGDGELKVEVKVTASCPSGDVLGGTANHIELKGPSRSDSTGSADAVVASGDFDFSDSPLVIPDSGTTLMLRFGEGHFFRTADDLDVKTITVACTPDRASGTSGATAGVPSASGSSNPSSASASASTTSQDSASEESAAESSLKWQVDHDRPSVTKDLTGKWVAQLSSKKPGMTADGMTWDNRTTLQEFLKLRQKYPSAKLLYSEDWPVFDAGGQYWVTIAGTPYSTAAEANAWCEAQGFDAEHCFAKYIDTNGPSEGTTVNR